MQRIRVVVADDSATVRARIVNALSAAPDIEVVGEASDGEQAIALCRARRPDVVTLDMMMPVKNGLEATEHIMAFLPTPIVIVSASTNRGDLFRTYDALAAGALEVIEKPTASVAPEVWDRTLVETVRIASRVRVITHPRARLRPAGRGTAAALDGAAGQPAATEIRRIVGIGASTGGPAAVVQLLHELPADYPFPILVVLHMSAPFATALAAWFARESRLPVRGARDGEPLPEAGVILAPAEHHLVLDGQRLRLTQAPPRHSCRPSVDVLFESMARSAGPAAIGVLLTGMGRDGAEGLLGIRRRGGTTIAQDEASCVVFGMPGEAIARGAAELVMAPHAAGAFLRELALRAAPRENA